MAERTFADLKRGPKRPCGRCGINETTVSLRVQAQHRSKGGPAGNVLASRSMQLCESCAVAVYETLDTAFADAIRAGLPTIETSGALDAEEEE